MRDTTAIIIARAGSQRLPNKNMRRFHGLPLVAHKVRQLKTCKHVSRVIVGSDSEEILNAAIAEGAETRVRAVEFCDEISRTWNEVILDMALRVPGEVILWAHCTNPCIRPSTYDRALVRYHQILDEKLGDSLLSVRRVEGHAWHGNRPINHMPWGAPHLVAAQLDPVYFQDGGIFIYDRARMIRDQYVYGHLPVVFSIEKNEGIDIDTEKDFLVAEEMFDWTQT